MSYSVRKMKRSEMQFAVDEAAKQGWNPGKFDGNCFFNTDPDGFFIGLYKNEPVGCISAVAYNSNFGFIGFFIVKPEHQNTQLAVMLSLTARERLKGRNIGLDGVFERQESYAGLGFKFAYSNIRFESHFENTHREGLVPVSILSFDKILDYDTKCFPVKREKFLWNWLYMQNIRTLALVENSTIRGYGAIRSCVNGFKLGPLFADSGEIAERLLLGLSSFSNGEPVYFDIPEINELSLAIADKYNMTKVFGTARMYSHFKPVMHYNKIFGITSYELG